MKITGSLIAKIASVLGALFTILLIILDFIGVVDTLLPILFLLLIIFCACIFAQRKIEA